MVARKEIGAVNDKTEWQVSRNHFSHIDLEIPIAHVELEKIRVGERRKLREVVIADRQSPTPAESVVAGCRQCVAEVALEEEITGSHVSPRNAANQVMTPIGLQPAARTADFDVVLCNLVASCKRNSSDQALGEVDAIHHLALADRSCGVSPEGLFDVANFAHHINEFVGLKAHLVIVSFEPPIERYVLFNDRSAPGNRSDGDMVPAFMAGIANQAVTDLCETIHVAEVYVSE